MDKGCGGGDELDVSLDRCEVDEVEVSCPSVSTLRTEGDATDEGDAGRVC